MLVCFFCVSVVDLAKGAFRGGISVQSARQFVVLFLFLPIYLLLYTNFEKMGRRFRHTPIQSLLIVISPL